MRAARASLAGLFLALACLASVDRARSAAWLPPAELASGSVSWEAAAMTPQGEVIAAWRIFEAGQYKIEASVRQPGGEFSAPTDLIPLGTIVENIDIATSPGGDAIVTWRKSFGGSDLRLFYSYRPAGGGFSSAREVAGAGTHVALPDTALDSAGNAITVFRRAPGGDDHIAYVYRPAGGEYGEQQELTNYTADGPVVEFASDGSAIAAWTTGISQGVVESARLPAGGGFGGIQPVSSEDAGRARLAVGPQGRALLSWSRFVGAIEAVEASLAEPGGSFGNPVPLSDAGVDSGLPVPAVGPDDTAFVAWAEGEGFELRSAAAPPGGALARAPAPAASDAFPRAAGFAEDGRLMLLWSAGETAPFVTAAAVRSAAGAFDPAMAVSQAGESTDTDGLSGDGKGNFVALYSRDDGGGKYTLKTRLYDGEPPQFLSLSVPQRARTGKPVRFSAGPSDTWSAVSGVEWSFGDGHAATGDSVKHTYRRTGGRRKVTVTATDAAGNSRTEERTVLVKDVTPVVISRARFRPSRFAVSGRKRGSTSKLRRGSTLRFRLSEPARVRISFQRSRPGRRKGKRCLAPRRGRGGKRCARWARPPRARQLKRSGRRGGNRVRVTGRLGGRALAPGRYRAKLVATDSGRLRSRPKYAPFKVVGG